MNFIVLRFFKLIFILYTFFFNIYYKLETLTNILLYTYYLYYIYIIVYLLLILYIYIYFNICTNSNYELSTY